MNYSKENETWWKRMKEPTTEASPFTCSVEPVDSAPHTIGELPPCLTSPLLYSSALKCMWTVYDVKREQLKGAFHQDSAQIPEMLKKMFQGGNRSCPNRFCLLALQPDEDFL